MGANDTGAESVALTGLVAGGNLSVVIERTARTAAVQFSATVRSFLEECLLTEDGDHSQPFGGRESTLSQLSKWLDNQTGKPRLLLAAPPGRGKSAVLVRWVTAQQDSSCRDTSKRGVAWNIVFFPFTSHLNLNQPAVFFQAIAARLAEILCSRAYADPSNQSISYEDQCRVLLDDAVTKRVPILLVIDGIDEALGDSFNANWFPRRPGKLLRIVVSARLQVGASDAAGWLERLGWRASVTAEVCELSALTLRDVESLLCETLPSLQSRTDRGAIVERVAALTAGEPLVLALYLRDLQSQDSNSLTLDVKHLDSLNPGLGGYFRDWMRREQSGWAEERAKGVVIDENVLLACLSILACAYGPLSALDLNELTRRMGTPLPAHLPIEGALRPLRRFILGTGGNRASREYGYVLGHPRFADFLRDEFFDRHQITKVRRAFAAWGEKVLKNLKNGGLSPTEPTPYLLHYLGQHLEDAEAPVALFLHFTDGGWLKACANLDPSYEGAASDIKRALVIAGRPGNQSRAAQVRCKLFLSSIDSRFFNRNVELDALCIADGILDVKLVPTMLAHGMSPDIVAQTIRATAAYLPESLVPLVEVYSKTLTGMNKVIALCALAVRYCEEQRSKLLSEATEAATSLEGELEGALALLYITAAQPEARRVHSLELAMRRTNLLDSEGLSDQETILFTSLLSNSQRRHLVARKLWAAHTRLRLPNGQASAHQIEVLRVQAMFCRFLTDRHKSRIVGRVCRLIEGARRSDLVAEFASLLGPALSLKACHDLLATMPNAITDERDIFALVAIAHQLPSYERRALLEKALASEERLKDELATVKMFNCMADLLPEPERNTILTDMLALCRAISSPRVRCNAFAELAFKAPELLASFLEEWIFYAKNVVDESRIGLLSQVALLMSPSTRGPMLSELTQHVQSAKEPAYRAKHSLTLAGFLPEEHRKQAVDQARDLILSLSPGHPRVVHYAELFRFLKGENQTELVPLILEDLKNVSEGSQRIREALRIAENADEIVRSQLLHFALEEYEKLKAPERVLDKALIARLASGETRRVLTAQALGEARHVGNPHLLAECMSMLSPVMAPEGDLTHVDDFLRAHGQISRRSLIFWLANFLPLIARYEGTGSLRELRQTTLDVYNFFP